MRSDSRDDEMNGRFGFGGIAESLGDVIAANPAAAGGLTAFAVAMTFFTANAVYFQDSPHPSALFATRPQPTDARPANAKPAAAPRQRDDQNVTRIILQSANETSAETADRLPVPVARERAVEERTTASASPAPIPAQPLPPGGERQIAGIQELLAKLGYYGGPVDGLKGPMTDAAIDAYKQKSGLRGIQLTEAELMLSIRNNLDVTAAIPAPVPAARPGDDATAPPLPSQIPSAEVVKVQAALKAFGSADVTVDGIAGAQTELAIREFQSLFRLPVTGEIDGPLLDKMREVGLIQ